MYLPPSELGIWATHKFLVSPCLTLSTLTWNHNSNLVNEFLNIFSLESIRQIQTRQPYFTCIWSTYPYLGIFIHNFLWFVPDTRTASSIYFQFQLNLFEVPITCNLQDMDSYIHQLILLNDSVFQSHIWHD